MLLLTLGLVNTWAQRIGNETATVRFNRLPTKPLPAEFTTYSASVSTLYKDLTLANLSPQLLVNKHFVLRGFKQFPHNGHFHINVDVGELVIISSKIKKKDTTTENKDGVKTTTSSYYRQIKYRLPLVLLVVDMNGNILLEDIQNGPKDGMKFDFKDGRKNFSSRQKLLEVWHNQQATVMNQLRLQVINSTCESFANSIKNKFDTRMGEHNVQLKLPKGKKLPNGAEFEQMTQQAITILNSMTADAPVAPLQEQLQPVLDFWAAQAEAYLPTDKRTTKIHHACLYNLALVHFYLENFELAKDYHARCDALDLKENTTSSLLEKISAAEERMIAFGTNTRHFAFDFTEVTKPAQADYSYLYKRYQPPAALAPSSVQNLPGYFINLRGDSLRGEFVFSNGKIEEPRFQSGGNVTFVYLKNGETFTKLLDPTLFQRASFNDRLFIRKSYSGVLALRNKPHIVEVLLEGERMQLYRAFPFEEGSSIPQDGELVIQKTGEKAVVLSVVNPRFTAWKKAFAEFFTDCEALYAEIRVGEFPRKDSEIVRAILLYNNNDCE